jgi:hypothetical protein
MDNELIRRRRIKEVIMSNVSSKNKWQVILMRWVARLVSIPWAYFALGVVWFIAGSANYEEGMSVVLYIIIVTIAFLLTMVAAILAGVWGLELLGGTVLLADSALIIICFIVSPHLRPTLVEFFTPSALPFNFVPVLPPLVAGALFIECHRISKKPRERQVNPKF